MQPSRRVFFLIFVLAAAVVWWAGVRVARAADALAERTKLGDAVIGVVLLALVTSLPEIAASVTGAVRGQAALAVNNVLGGLAFQVAVLALADAAGGRRALRASNTDPLVLLQAALNVVLLTVVAIGITVGETALPGGVGAWSASLVPLYAVSLLLTVRRRRAAWRATRGAGGEARNAEHEHEHVNVDESAGAHAGDERSVAGLLARIAVFAAIILVAGYALTRAAEGIADDTGLGAGFVGAVLLAAATSLPEISTATAAVRLGRPGMALGDIFGTNLIDVSLVFVVDLVYAGPPVLGLVGRFSLLAALLGIATTIIYVVGLVERHERTVLRLGVDSLLVVLAYLGGVALLYGAR